jgi:acyl transferase domain-containing protein
MGFLSPNNKCYSFDDRADGYARGEGIGVIILKSLSQAVQDGNTIRAVIRATGINQDGRTPGITQPSWQAQKKLICSTYQKAGLDMMSTSYVEAHGTGTPLGDPIEVKGIARAFRDTKSPIYVGSVKANIGHTEGASGIAGVIKTVLILENGLIPANIWLKNLNPRVEAEARNLIFPVETTPWPSDGLRRASVNSFGFGGTNAHIVLDDAFHFLQSHGLKAPHHTTTSFPARNYRSGYEQDNKASVDGIVEHGPKILTLSAFDETGIRRLKDAYCQSAHQWHDDDPRIDFNLAFTLSQKRNRLPWCTFAITQPSNFSFDRLEWSTPRRIERQPKVCFVFTGQGAQWLRMGAELLENEVFRKSIHEANSHLRTFGCRWSLIGGRPLT